MQMKKSFKEWGRIQKSDTYYLLLMVLLIFVIAISPNFFRVPLYP
jgi:hypothetical protein